MRRPKVPPEQATALIRERTWLGMAKGRVPAAFPVPRVRIPRLTGATTRPPG